MEKLAQYLDEQINYHAAQANKHSARRCAFVATNDYENAELQMHYSDEHLCACRTLREVKEWLNLNA